MQLVPGQLPLRYPGVTAPGRSVLGATGASSGSPESGNFAPSGTIRVIMPPVVGGSTLVELPKHAFPANLNQGVDLPASQTKPVAKKMAASRVNGDTNARGPASIAELARALRYSPDLIYQYVRNNIEYYPIYGVQKGGLGAVLDNQGTDYDQAALMVALLRASNIQASYVRGVIRLSPEQVAAWWGVNTSNVCGIASILSQGQIPVYEIGADGGGSCPGLNKPLTSLSIEHAWVKVNIDGTWYVFDPSFKTHTRKGGIALASPDTTGYDFNSYFQAAYAGADVTTTYVQNMNRTNIRNNLTSYASKLANYLRTNMPTATLDDVIGGKTIDQFYGAIRQAALPYQDTRWGAVEYTDLPDGLKPTLRIQYQGIDQTYTSDAIYGKRLTITYNTANQPLLKVDGVQVGNPGAAATPGSGTPITLTVFHPYSADGNSNSANQQAVQSLRAGGTNTYVIANGWGPAGRGLAENYRRVISDLRASGATDTSEPLLGSTLAAIGAQWIAQNDQSGYITGQLNSTVDLAHHRVGIVGYVNNAYVDLPMNALAVANEDGNVNLEDGSFANWATHASILESTAVQQTTGVAAVSTVKLIDIASAAGLRIYNASSANFTSQVQPNLINCGNYIGTFSNEINAGRRVIVPARCDIGEGNWAGAGWYVIGSGRYLGAMIDQNLYGGFSTANQIASQVNLNVNQNQLPPSFFQNVSPFTLPVGDPVDTVAGNFLYNNDDLTSGVGASPQSLTFTRLYSSGMRNENGPLGKGWTHNFNQTVTAGSDGFQAMGEDSALDAVGAIIEHKVSLDVLGDPTYRILNIVIAALGQRWYGDQLVNNTVIVTRGLNGEVFVALPDGTYNPPPGSSARLLKNADGTYSYESVHRGLLKFNAVGKAESYTDPSGIQIRYTYSGSDLTQVQNSLGRTLTFTMAGGRITKVDNGSFAVGYGYDGNANLTTFTDPSGKNTTFAYAQPGQMSGLFYPSFPTISVATNVYDSLGRVKTQTNARGKTYEYYFAGSRTEEVAPGNISRTRYIDALGNVVQSATPLGNYTINIYDGLGRLIKTQFPENNGLTYSYDDATCAGPDKRCTNNVRTVSKVAAPGTNVAPLTQSFNYEGKFNQVAAATDARGKVTSFSYTDQGQPLTITSPADATGVSPVATYGYETFTPNGYPSFVLPSTITVKINGNGDVTTTSTSYNAGNHYVPSASVVDSGAGRMNLTTRFSYDSVGNVTEVDGPRIDVAQVAKYQYDASRRVVVAINGLGKEARTTYDPDGRPIIRASQLGAQWLVNCTQYSETGKVLRIWGPGVTGSSTTCPTAAPTAVTDTAYDDLDRVSRVTQYLSDAQGGNRVTATAYYNDDTVQSVSKAVGTPLAQTYATFTYSPNGNVTSVKDARGYATVYAYDGFDRLTRTYYPLPNSPNLGNQNDYEETGYDANGNVTSLRRRSGEVITQGWDDLNRLISRSYPNSANNVQFTYDLRGLRTGASFSNGSYPVIYGWDMAGRLTSESENGKTMSSMYDAASNRTRLTWPDGFFVSTRYDALNRTDSIRENDSQVLAQYAYDDLSRRTTVTLGNGTRTERQYDDQNQLSSLAHYLQSAAQNVKFTYARNQLGDLTSLTTSNGLYQWSGSTSGAKAFVANGLNQYTTLPQGSPVYDANGNMTNDGRLSYAYDSDNRLRSASGQTVQATLAYDPVGRLRQTVIGSTTNLLYDGGRLVAEYGADGSLKRRYVHGPGIDEPIVRYADASTNWKNWFYTDHLGSIVGVSDGSGKSVGAYRYGPFGETNADSAGRFGYTGQQYVAELGLYYYKARVYSSTLGRFLQTDPSGPSDDLNLYTYVGNNSINRVDPSGLQSTIRGDAFQSAGVDFLRRPRDEMLLEGGGGGGGLGGPTGAAGRVGLGGVKDVTVSRGRFPETAAHIEDAQNAGQPSTLTIDRAGAAANRRDSLRGTDPISGKDRDEYPPAMFREGGTGASVRPISPSDNRGAGSCIGAQCRGLPNGAQVNIRITD
ncbi:MULTISPECIES: RHS repeat-associated core domain-containing protein [Burkholderia]|nr:MULTISPECIES: RHS repeat-associated core domain-containing protein [Burkholderia]